MFKAGVPEDEARPGEDVHACFERAEQALADCASSPLVSLARAKVQFQRVPLEFVSQLTAESRESRLQLALESQLQAGREAFTVVPGDLALSLEVLRSFDDLLDIVENFGDARAADEGLDSDEEAGGEGEADADAADVGVELASTHPLFPVRENLPSHYDWLEEALGSLDAVATTAADAKLLRDIATARGELALRRAQPAVQHYLQEAYGDDTEITEQTRELGVGAAAMLRVALEHLERAQDPEDPDTWVAVAEATIELGNVLEQDSEEQARAYADAEGLLERANVAAHGKYKDVLENLGE